MMALGPYTEVTKEEIQRRTQEGMERAQQNDLRRQIEVYERRYAREIEGAAMNAKMQGAAFVGQMGPESSLTQGYALPQGGRKFDQAKPDYTLLPWGAVEEVVKVLDFGARKYARDNWKHVDSAETRYLAAAFRHLSAYAQGEKHDPETGLNHMAHAACCVLFIMGLETRNETNK
jgi:hypothetical protein